MDRFVVADIGSTTTKAILFQRATEWEFVRREAPTTVEAPHEDVAVGLAAAMRALGEASGETLLESGVPAVPLFLTSSAGGGLAMVTVGLVERVTSRSAQRAALGAGAILLDTIAHDDGRVPYRKVLALTELRPDILLFAGGFDGEAIGGPVLLAEIVRQAHLRPKLSPEALLPLVYAGNVHAKDLVEETLGGRFLFRAVPNIRPESDVENLEPARQAIHELFMEHVMSHAPGYGRLVEWVSAPVMPTPSAMGEILRVLSRSRPGRILAIDIGGATTDVFTAEDGEVLRTVSANLGMSYSALNVVGVAGISAVADFLEGEMSHREILNRIGNKYLKPTLLPGDETERRVEWALAKAAIREAVREHLGVLGGDPISRGRTELSIRSIGKRSRAAPEENGGFALEGYSMVIGSGGVLSHSPRAAAARILYDALLPTGIVTLAVDSAFMLPHLGLVSTVDAELAAELAERLAVVPLGTVIAAGGPVKPGRGSIAIEGTEAPVRVPGGECRVLPLPAGERAELRIQAKGLTVDGERASARGGALGILVDARGRPPVGPAPDFPAPGVVDSVERAIVPEDRPVFEGVIRKRRELAIPGTVLVEVGERVESETVIARCTRTFPRPFFLKPAAPLGVEGEEVAQHLLVGPGDEIEMDQVIAQRDRGILGDKFYRTPVSGTVERILKNGTVVVREKEETSTRLFPVDVAAELAVQPARRVEPYLKVVPGQEVDRGFCLAQKMESTGRISCLAPVRGVVDRIDLEYGIILIAPLSEELTVGAFMPGTITEVTERGAVVANEGVRIRGAWGYGDEAVGILVPGALRRDHVVVLDEPRQNLLASLAEIRPAALVTGGLDLQEVIDAAPTFPVVLTEGFGERGMARETYDRLAAHRGRLAMVDATTELRVGVRRPEVILPASGIAEPLAEA